jgi:hypothetical protein
MDTTTDVTIHIPAEHLDDFVKVMAMGIQRAKLSQEARKTLASWWTVEHEMIRDDQENNSGA